MTCVTCQKWLQNETYKMEKGFFYDKLFIDISLFSYLYKNAADVFRATSKL